jgi:Ca2+-binding EF-hand superfamily protein
LKLNYDKLYSNFADKFNLRREKKVKFAFQVFDLDGSGSIDAEELRKIVKVGRCRLTVSNPVLKLESAHPFSA